MMLDDHPTVRLLRDKERASEGPEIRRPISREDLRELALACGADDAGIVGTKLAAPEKEVICFVGDGSYMMANSEIATR